MSYPLNKKSTGNDSAVISADTNQKKMPVTVSVDMARRQFIRVATASAAAFAASACGGGAAMSGGSTVGSSADSATSTQSQLLPGGANHPPVWTMIPSITFTQGLAASISIAAYVSDADNDPLTITKNSLALPAGVTYDAATKSFIYDGIGVVASTNGHVLTATEG